jgi:hypothetical protein
MLAVVDGAADRQSAGADPVLVHNANSGCGDSIRIRAGQQAAVRLFRLSPAELQFVKELLDDITWIAYLAVRVSFQRLLEESRIVLYRERRLPSAADVARQGQNVVGRHAVQAAGDSAEPAAEIARRARWEEARWQLGHLISCVPFPVKLVSAVDGGLEETR